MSEPSPLGGVRVLDLTRALSGPFCTMILGDLGADVIKVEPPDGDMMRQWGPYDRTESVYYLTGNRNKRAIAINFRSKEGLELIKSLAKECDVAFTSGLTTTGKLLVKAGADRVLYSPTAMDIGRFAT